MADIPVVAITGGTSGIGLATARQLIRRGYLVAALGLDDAATAAARATLPATESLVLTGDVTDPAVSEDLIAAAVARWGGLDGLVACAAARAVGNVPETGSDVWERTISVNLTGVFHSCRAAIPRLIAADGGSIVVVGSASGYGGEGHAAYATSKGALMSLAMSMALDHRRERVRVNVVVPGMTRTPMNEGLRDAETEARIADRSSVTGDLNSTDDVASVVTFLLSDDARAVSGAVIDVGYFHGEPFRRVDGA